jgi:hypothetical protein
MRRLLRQRQMPQVFCGAQYRFSQNQASRILKELGP